MSQNDQNELMVQMKAAELMDDIISDLSEYNRPEPRIHCINNFPALAALSIVYDKFCAILEVNHETDELEYIAIGRTESDHFIRGAMDLVDIRFLEDEERFRKAVKLFKSLSDTHEPDFARDVECSDDMDKEVIVPLIIDCWKLQGEKDMWGVH